MNETGTDPVSPITGGKVRHLTSLSTRYVCELYRAALGFDLEPYIEPNLTLDLLECLDTGYQFYAPLAKVEGSPEFYATLYSTVGAEWGYRGDKWEHKFALKYCANAKKLLDVGCGGGAFLSLAKEHADEVVGLETSAHGRAVCRESGIFVLDEVIQSHRMLHPGEYDVLCSFQVLEHISNVRDFIESCIAVVKPGGTIIFSVPNNQAFVGNQELPLNMPPHHVGLWRPSSLEAIARFFGLDLLSLHYEPLQPENVDWYRSWLESTYLPRSRVLRSLWHRLGYSKSIGHYIQDNAHTIHGHTVMAVYRVTESACLPFAGPVDSREDGPCRG